MKARREGGALGALGVQLVTSHLKKERKKPDNPPREDAGCGVDSLYHTSQEVPRLERLQARALQQIEAAYRKGSLEGLREWDRGGMLEGRDMQISRPARICHVPVGTEPRGVR